MMWLSVRLVGLMLVLTPPSEASQRFLTQPRSLTARLGETVVLPCKEWVQSKKKCGNFHIWMKTLKTQKNAKISLLKLIKKLI